MNDETRRKGDEALFDDAEDATVTLSLDDGSELECAVLTIYEAQGRQYIALLPLGETGDSDGEVYLYRFSEQDGEPLLENIEDDDEYEAASDGFDEWLDDQEYDDLVFEDDEEDEDDA